MQAKNNRAFTYDNPSYVVAVWGSGTIDTQAPSAVTSLTVKAPTKYNYVTWTAAINARYLVSDIYF
jgi:hypothetical protein